MPSDQDSKPRRVPPIQKDFSKAASGKAPPPPPMPPELNLNPPELLGPGMGSRTRGQAFRPRVSPGLREKSTEPKQDEQSKQAGTEPAPPLKPTFNREARNGALRSVFDRNSRDPGPGLEP